MKTKAEQTKDKIVEAAKKVFSEKGFHGATTKEIAETANVSEGSLFRYFKSKKELLTYILKSSVLQGAVEIIKEEDNLSLAQIITKLIENRLEVSKEIFPIMKLIMFDNSIEQDMKKNLLKEIFIPLISELEAVFKHKQEKGELNNIETFTMSRFFACLIFGLISLNEVTQGIIFQKNPFSNEIEKKDNFSSFISQSVELYLNGILKKDTEIEVMYPQFFI